MLRHCLLACLLGCVAALSLPGFSFIGFIFVGLGGYAALFWRMERCGQLWRSFLSGYSFGFGYFVTGLYWIGNALLIEGSTYQWAYPLAVIGMPLGLSFFYGFSTLLIDLISRRRGIHIFSICYVVIFTAVEYLREFVFTGFPWNYFAYCWHSYLEIMQILAYVGIHGLNAITLLCCIVVLYGIESFRSRKFCVNFAGLSVLLIASFSITWFWGSVRITSQPDGSGILNDPLQVVLVQPNIQQHKKWDPELIDSHFDRLLEMSSRELVDQYRADVPIVIVWPETALHYRFYASDIYISRIKNMLVQYEGIAYLVTGALAVDFYGKSPDDYRVSNRLHVYSNDSQFSEKKYDKVHLVPFGEYIPFQEYLSFAPVAKFKNMQKGVSTAPIQLNDNFSFIPMICYEIIFSNEVAKRSEDNGVRVIINATNDGWYDDSAGPIQHSIQSQFRAIEYQKIVIRAANTGISSVFSPYGEILSSIRYGKKGTSYYIFKE